MTPILKRVLEESKRAASLRLPVANACTRGRILDAAEDLLQRRGFNAFSYNHIAVRLGLRHAAIHYHFRNKSDLGVALVRRYRIRFDEWLTDLEGRTHDPWEQLLAYFGVCHDYLQTGHQVCPGGILGAEYQSLPESMREETRLMLAEIYDWLARVLESGRRSGYMAFTGDAGVKALEVGAALQGALQITRVTGGKSQFERLLDHLQIELRAAGDG